MGDGPQSARPQQEPAESSTRQVEHGDKGKPIVADPDKLRQPDLDKQKTGAQQNESTAASKQEQKLPPEFPGISVTDAHQPARGIAVSESEEKNAKDSQPAKERRLPTMAELGAAIKNSQPIGQGISFSVYEIPGYPDLVVRLKTEHYLTADGKLKPKFARSSNPPVLLADPYQGKVHVGQAVALYHQDGEASISVLSKQEGDTVRGPDQIADRKAHAEKVLRAAAEMPALVNHPIYGRIDPYRSLLRDAGTLASMGAVIDPRPTNLHINPGKGFGLIDVATPKGKGPTTVVRPQLLVNMILDPGITYGSKIDSGSISNSRRVILERMYQSCQAEGIEFLPAKAAEHPNASFEDSLAFAGYEGEELRQMRERYAQKPHAGDTSDTKTAESGLHPSDVTKASDLPTMTELSAAIKPSQAIGRGGGSTVYDIPGHPDLVVRVSTTYYLDGRGRLQQQFAQTSSTPTLVADPYQGRIHVGQAVAIYREDGINSIEVLRKQEGNNVQGLARVANRPAHAQNILRAAAEMPALIDHPVYGRIDPYVALLRDAKVLGEMGAQIDPKPSNLLINPNKGFGFVDIAVPTGQGPMETAGPMVLANMIIDTHQTDLILGRKAERSTLQNIAAQNITNSRRIILERMYRACQSEGVPFFKEGPDEVTGANQFEFQLSSAGYKGDELRQIWQRYANAENASEARATDISSNHGIKPDRRPDLPTMVELSRAITEARPISQNARSSVYEIPGHPDLVVRIPNQYINSTGGLDPELTQNSASLSAIVDPYYGWINVGQTVANYHAVGKDSITVLRKQEGDTVHGSEQIADRKAHAEKVLKAAAELPALVDHPTYGRIDPYVALLRDDSLLSELGAVINPEPNNLHINPEKGFGLINVGLPAGKGPTGNVGPLALVNMITDPKITQADGINSESMTSSRRIILDRMHQACQSESIQFFPPGLRNFNGASVYDDPLKLAGYEGDALQQRRAQYAHDNQPTAERGLPTTADLYAAVRDTKPIGTSQGTNVYNIAGYPDLVVRLSGSSSFRTTDRLDSHMSLVRSTPVLVDDPYQGRVNAGQTVAVYRQDHAGSITVLRKQEGDTPRGPAHITDQKDHSEKVLRAAAEMPQLIDHPVYGRIDPYVALLRDARVLAEVGASINPGPGNLLINPEKGFGFVDVRAPKGTAPIEGLGPLMLVNQIIDPTLSVNSESMVNSRRAILERMYQACQSEGRRFFPQTPKEAKHASTFENTLKLAGYKGEELQHPWHRYAQPVNNDTAAAAHPDRISASELPTKEHGLPTRAELDAAIRPAQLIGQSNMCTVYDIPSHPDLVVKVFNSYVDPATGRLRPEAAKISSSPVLIDDPFPGRINVGQEVALYHGKFIAVLRKQNGDTVRGTGQVVDKIAHAEKVLKAAAEMPHLVDHPTYGHIDPYVALVRDAKMLGELGAHIDFNPANLLINPGKGFGLIDVGIPDGKRPVRVPAPLLTLVNMIIDPTITRENNINSENITRSRQTILERMHEACVAEGIKFFNMGPAETKYPASSFEQALELAGYESEGEELYKTWARYAQKPLLGDGGSTESAASALSIVTKADSSQTSVVNKLSDELAVSPASTSTIESIPILESAAMDETVRRDSETFEPAKQTAPPALLVAVKDNGKIVYARKDAHGNETEHDLIDMLELYEPAVKELRKLQEEKPDDPILQAKLKIAEENLANLQLRDPSNPHYVRTLQELRSAEHMRPVFEHMQAEAERLHAQGERPGHAPSSARSRGAVASNLLREALRSQAATRFLEFLLK